MSLLRQPILLLSRSDRLQDLLTRLPATARMVAGYVAGTGTDDVLAVAEELAADGLSTSLDHLGEDTRELHQADATVAAYLELLGHLPARGLSRSAEVSVKLSAIGLALPDGDRVALENARTICRAARNAGTTITVDMEDHTTTDATLGVLRELRKDFPETGAVLQAQLHRTLDDCRGLAHEGSRVRLCKGAYAAPESVAWTDPNDVDRAFVRCLKILMAGQGHPMIATHDPTLIEVALALAGRHRRPQGSYEFQMLYGVRPEEQRRLAAAGEHVRVYVPYGSQWYPYLVRRMAERPRNLSLFITSLVSKR
ncbi:proline dehydrogenase family protein [Nocardioides ochotonae]|uniref:proline dehydrogenase family protein n=1 Tax=Nocardioides ochotonae TaxID=2685869 RepID=UPI00140737E3|nr:proline dehydrogenase family protein [Nocardioides ochotonae]